MPVELRKRKAPAAPAAPAPPAKKASRTTTKTNPVKAVAAKAKAAITANTKKPSTTAVTKNATNGAPTVAVPKGGIDKVKVGDVVTLEGFGGEVETNDGVKTTLKALVEGSKNGVAIFTYPKASTPGCTTQACNFRDGYTSLTSTGLSIYGLSTDSPKANTNFKTKQNLPYTLLCDPDASLIGAIGLKKSPKGTTRGVFVIDKEGKVLAAEPGSPTTTVDVVKKLVGGVEANGIANDAADKEADKKKEDVEKAEVAGEVADTAAKLDGGVEGNGETAKA
ncbi:hypothetical protein FGG08_001209 [Glutinoglossum americanum]|uniref:thioredoxin-dependent peroxiredoxin n=1 Tax=Glutinoglossum americanum TaxID=1670608 RepID=A0A9P8I7J4_9PEZI|nr:hypothetical protein FGG08_001209 [Glutinoglossum americanum]